MTILKKLTATLVLAATLLAIGLPVGAVTSSFTDVSDSTTATNAEILRLMGVVAGYGDGAFRPDATLTRAEFCTMAVKLMGLDDKVSQYTTRTIFSDVTSSHWARGYVNLAASTTVSTGKETSVRLISGVGNGTFAPDANITYAQAVTILIRILGYGDSDVGAVWPSGYLNLADSLGLTDGLALSADTPLNRAQTAQLLVNTLSAKQQDGTFYYKSLGTVKEDTVLLAVNVEADDRSQGAIRTSAGTYLPKVDGVAPSALQGHRGTLVLNDRNEIVTFIPDESASTTVMLAGNAEPGFVKGLGGVQYTIPSDTPVYTADKVESETYANTYTSLVAGTQITLFSYRGKVVSVYASMGAVSTSDGAVVVTGSASDVMFHQLTGGASDYTITKNRQTITMSDIRPYDVVTYDSLSNTLVVSDLRLSCIYEDPAPNAKAPKTLTVLGHEFPVMESAWNYTKDFSAGNSVVLLLTADGKVAGVVTPTAQLRSTAVGIVTGAAAVKVFLPNGNSIELKGSGSQPSADMSNLLVTVSSGSTGRISASRLSTPSGSGYGDFDLENMTLGNYSVTRGVRIFEQVSGGAMVEISISGLDLSTVPANKLAAYHLNTSSMVDYIVFDNVSGDAYVYGKLVEGKDSHFFEGSEFTNRTVTVENGTESKIKSMTTGYPFQDNAFGGAVIGADGKIASVVELTKVTGVSPSDFFARNGRTYVTVKGVTYLVADNVECYKSDSKSWFTEKTGSDRLTACKAFSSELTIYVDPVGQKVRVVTAD